MKASGSPRWVESGRTRLKLAWDFILLLLVEPVAAFFRDDGFQKAGMLAYYTFMSFLPLFLALVLVGSRFVDPGKAASIMQNLVGHLLPQSRDLVLREVEGLASQKAWSLVSIVVLFWWMMPVASILRVTFTSIFKIPPHALRPGVGAFILGKLYDMGSLLLIVALMAVLIGTGWLNSLSARWLAGWPLLRTLVDYGVPTAASFLCLFLFFFLFVPPPRKGGAILAGAVVSAVLLKLMNPVFSLMLQFNPDYGYMFGSLKAIFFFFVWIYYASISILLGAEVMSCLVRRREVVLRDQVKRLLSGDSGLPRYRFLARNYIKVLKRGEEVFRQGDNADELYVIVRGRLAMVRDGRVVSMMEKGRCFGEVGALLKLPRLASARVESDEAEIVALSPAHLSDPELLVKLLQDMAGRLVRSEASPSSSAPHGPDPATGLS